MCGIWAVIPLPLCLMPSLPHLLTINTVVDFNLVVSSSRDSCFDTFPDDPPHTCVPTTTPVSAPPFATEC
jgi:hypothetical protein